MLDSQIIDDLFSSEGSYNRYLDITKSNNSKSAFFSDCFSNDHLPSDGLVDFREAKGKLFCGGNVNVKQIRTTGKGRVVIVLGEGCIVHNILINNMGEDLFLFFGPGSELKNLVIYSLNKNNYLHFGCGTTNDGGNYLLQGDNNGIFIGHDCMFSTNLFMRTSDSHSIYEYAGGNRINYDQSISIGDHVWIGRQVSVGKGAQIEDDAVIGQCSFVSGKVNSSAIYAGVPAKKIKDNVTWDRTQSSSLADISSTLSWRPRQKKVNEFLKNDQPFSSSSESSQIERRRFIPEKKYRWLDSLDALEATDVSSAPEIAWPEQPVV